MPTALRPLARPSQTPQAPAEFSLLEAAFVSGLTTREVNSVVDENEVELLPCIQRAPGKERRDRSLGATAVAYLSMRQQYQALLSPDGRRALYAVLRELPDTWATLLAPPIEQLTLSPGMTVALNPVWAQLVERMRLLESANESVEANPGINGGEPVVRGTRVSVAVLADLTKQGATEQELLEDYPTVTADGLRAALRYAELHPRRGRPRGTLGPRSARADV